MLYGYQTPSLPFILQTPLLYPTQKKNRQRPHRSIHRTSIPFPSLGSQKPNRIGKVYIKCIPLDQSSGSISTVHTIHKNASAHSSSLCALHYWEFPMQPPNNQPSHLPPIFVTSEEKNKGNLSATRYYIHNMPLPATASASPLSKNTMTSIAYSIFANK